jgi:hypothetical protein
MRLMAGCRWGRSTLSRAACGAYFSASSPSNHSLPLAGPVSQAFQLFQPAGSVLDPEAACETRHERIQANDERHGQYLVLAQSRFLQCLDVAFLHCIRLNGQLGCVVQHRPGFRVQVHVR